jgi:hypothetical protein
MATVTQVTAGDLITAELMNEILARLGSVEGKVVVSPGGAVTVLSFVGQQLSATRTTLIAPTTQLSLGFVINAAGEGVDLAAADSGALIVINQVPPGGTKVNAGTPISLVVSSAGSGSASQSKPKPKITSVTPEKVNAGLQVQIIGENFALSRFQNEVFFNGFRGPDPTSASGPTSLFVVVPKNLPNVPSGTAELAVTIKVVTPEGDSTLSGKLVVLAALPGPDFAVTEISPGSVTANATTPPDITIKGSGFNATIASNIVEFAKSGGAVTKATPKPSSNPAEGVLVVGVPSNIVGLQTGANTVQVVVNIKDTQQRTPAQAITVTVVGDDV